MRRLGKTSVGGARRGSLAGPLALIINGAVLIVACRTRGTDGEELGGTASGLLATSLP